MREKTTGKQWKTILALAASLLGVAYFLVQALGAGGLWLFILISSWGRDITQAIPIGLLAWSSILSGLLLLPAALLNFFKLKSRPAPSWLDTGNPRFRKIVLGVILIWPVIVLLGWLAAGQPTAAAFLLAPLSVLAAGLPILWLVNVSQWGLETGPEKRKWELFGFSLAVSPIVIIVVELIAIVALTLVGGLVLGLRMADNPRIERDLMHIVNQVAIAGDDLDMVLKLLQPLLLQPAVIYWSLAIFAGIMPIIEELIKPLALWALADRDISPREGFVGGLLCGAGFALLENVLYFTSAIAAEDWLIMAISRSSTGVLHMLATGLVGWGLARAWRDGKWPFLALTTLGAFVLHGLWNALALAAGVAPLFVFGIEPGFWKTILFYIPLILLFLIAIGGMVGINRYLKRQQARENSSESPDAEDSDALPEEDTGQMV